MPQPPAIHTPYCTPILIPSTRTKSNMIMGMRMPLLCSALALLLLVLAASSSSLPAAPLPNNSFPIAKPNCTDLCGNVRIPYPFGTTPECYHSYGFFITCNHTFNPPRPFVQDSPTMQITHISLDGQLTILNFIARDCYDRNRTRVSYSNPWINLPISLTVNNTANKFTIVGCDTYGFVSGRRLNRNYQTGCTAMCDSKDDLAPGSCTGLGCCQTSIPKDVWKVEISLRSYENHSYVWRFNNCSYAFLVQESAFTFSPANLTNLRHVKMLPMVADWAIGNGTCEEAQRNASGYACRSLNSTCYKPSNGYGYRCSCPRGYQGNPYILDGCHDIDECADARLNMCEKRCENIPGDFICHCPRGYHGDGRKDGRGCVRSESLLFKLAAGIALGVVVLLLSACWLQLELKRRALIRMRQKFFFQNGGVLLQEKLNRRESTSEATKIFSAPELQKATNDFHNSMIIGQGGFGTVYKGILSDNRVVAIKKSKVMNPNQIEQFINEVIVLSQVNHRNVVKLLGCCLETQVPLLVYEFINNGTLFEHIHNKAKARYMSWELRLKIATETAGVLSYLHSAASPPIIHRDVKSANILLDHTYTAKVSDFGASKLVPLDESQLSTMVQGTLGYLDPEYMQTNQLTEKSDVYSFGVVLVELLTGMKALSYEREEKDTSLANFFLSIMKQEQIFQVVDNNVMREGSEKQIKKFAMLAKSCLRMRGEERPFMKNVAMELEGLRYRWGPGGRHSWAETNQHKEEEEEEEEGESLLNSEGFSGIIMDSSGFDDSIKDHVVLPQGTGGR